MGAETSGTGLRGAQPLGLIIFMEIMIGYVEIMIGYGKTKQALDYYKHESYSINYNHLLSESDASI